MFKKNKIPLSLKLVILVNVHLSNFWITHLSTSSYCMLNTTAVLTYAILMKPCVHSTVKTSCTIDKVDITKFYHSFLDLDMINWSLPFFLKDNISKIQLLMTRHTEIQPHSTSCHLPNYFEFNGWMLINTSERCYNMYKSKM